MARSKARHAQPVGAPWEGPTQDGVRPPSDSDEEDPRICARDPGGADLDESEIADFRGYGDSFDWATVSPSIDDARFPGADLAGTLLGASVSEIRKNGRGGSLDLPRWVGGTAYDPHDANEAQRVQISISIGATRDWVEGESHYKQLRLIASGVAGTGKSFVIHALTGLIRTLLGYRKAAQAYAPAGVAAFHVVGQTSHRLPRPPTGKIAYGQLEPLKGEAIRLVQENLSGRARLIGDERGVIGRAMRGWKEYRSQLAPFRGAPGGRDPRSWCGRPCVDLLGGDFHLPPVVDSP